MIQVKLNNATFPLDTMSVGTWQKIARFDMTEKAYWPKIVATALHIDERMLIDAPEETLELGVSFIRYALEYGDHQPLDVVVLDSMTFGDWIDLDIWMYDGPIRSLHLIIEKFAAGDTKTPMPAALQALEKISNWRRAVYRSFAGLLSDGEPETEASEETEDQKSGPDPRRVWYNVIIGLANEDILKMDEIVEMPFRNCLNFMSWRKEENLRRQRELNKIKQK